MLDLGAGLLSMLPRIQGAAAAAGWDELQYTAYEVGRGVDTEDPGMSHGAAAGWSTQRDQPSPHVPSIGLWCR